MRSSDWNLVRLEGHLIDQDGLNCDVSNDTIKCKDDEEKERIKIKESGLYEISISGVASQVYVDFEKRTKFFTKTVFSIGNLRLKRIYRIN